MIATGTNGKPSFTKADNGTMKRIMSQLGEKGPRAVMLYLAFVKLANERRHSESHPKIEDLNYPYLETVSGLNRRTMKRLIPELQRIGIIKHHPGGSFSPFAVTILKGYWPNGSEAESAAAPHQPDDIPERMKPAFAALRATGKMPNLTASVLQRVDGSHPRARIFENFQPIVDQLQALTGTVSDPMKWLLKQASEREVAKGQVRTHTNDPRKRKRSDAERFGD